MVLLRGYNVHDVKGFNEVVEAFGWDDIQYVDPTTWIHVHKRVWTTKEGPLSEFIYYYHEMVLVSERLEQEQSQVGTQN